MKNVLPYGKSTLYQGRIKLHELGDYQKIIDFADKNHFYCCYKIAEEEILVEDRSTRLFHRGHYPESHHICVLNMEFYIIKRQGQKSSTDFRGKLWEEKQESIVSQYQKIINNWIGEKK